MIKVVLRNFIIMLIMLSNVLYPSLMSTIYAATDKTYDTEARVLTDLNIFDKDNLAHLDLDKPLTRGELARIGVVLKFGGETNMLIEDSNIFSDVTTETNNYTYIMTAANSGIMNGTGGKSFEPDASALADQIYKVLLDVLGYEKIAQSKGGYPIGYQMLVGETGILKGIKKLNEASVSKNDAVKMVYNCLNAKMVTETYGSKTIVKIEQDISLLNSKFKIRNISGILLTPAAAGLHNGTKKEILIDNILYETTVENSDSNIGYYVKAYLKEENGVETIVSIELQNKADMLSIDAKDLIEVTQGAISYSDKNGKNELVQLEDQGLIIYNGIRLVTPQLVNIMPREGYLELIDNDNDGIYDVVRIWEYEILVVNKVDVDRGVIYDLYDSGKLLSLGSKGEKIYKITDGETELSISDIRKYDVLTIYMPKTKDNIIVNISSNYIKGVISEIANDYIVVDETKYSLTDYFKRLNSKIKINDDMFFHLDKFDRIVCTEIIDSNKEMYGYFIDIDTKQGVSDDICIKLLDQSGEMRILNLSKTIRINGTYARNLDIINTNPLTTALETQGVKNTGASKMEYVKRNFFVRQPIIYGLNESGNINYLDTSLKGSEETDDNLSMENYFTDSLKYSKWPLQFNDLFSVKISTQVFYVPVYENDVDSFGQLKATARNNLQDKDYLVSDINLFKDNSNYTNIGVYDVSKGGVANMLVYCYQTAANKGLKSLTSEICVVDKVTDVINDDGEMVKKIYMYRQGELNSYQVLNSDVLVDEDTHEKINLKNGDVIQITLTPKNEVDGVCVRFDSENRLVVKTDPSASFKGRFGEVYSCDSDGIRLFETGILKSFTLKTVANVYIYDKELKQVSVGTKFDIIDKLATNGNASYVFAQSTNTNYLTNVVIIK